MDRIRVSEALDTGSIPVGRANFLAWLFVQRRENVAPLPLTGRCLAAHLLSPRLSTFVIPFVPFLRQAIAQVQVHLAL